MTDEEITKNTSMVMGKTHNFIRDKLLDLIAEHLDSYEYKKDQLLSNSMFIEFFSMSFIDIGMDDSSDIKELENMMHEIVRNCIDRRNKVSEGDNND